MIKKEVKEVSLWDFCKHTLNYWYDAMDQTFYIQKDTLFLVEGLFLKEILSIPYKSDSILSAVTQAYPNRELRYMPYSDQPVKTKVPDWSNLNAK